VITNLFPKATEPVFCPRKFNAEDSEPQRNDDETGARRRKHHDTDQDNGRTDDRDHCPPGRFVGHVGNAFDHILSEWGNGD
jgi:hypothetical protein